MLVGWASSLAHPLELNGLLRTVIRGIMKTFSWVFLVSMFCGGVYLLGFKEKVPEDVRPAVEPFVPEGSRDLQLEAIPGAAQAKRLPDTGEGTVCRIPGIRVLDSMFGVAIDARVLGSDGQIAHQSRRIGEVALWEDLWVDSDWSFDVSSPNYRPTQVGPDDCNDGERKDILMVPSRLTSMKVLGAGGTPVRDAKVFLALPGSPSAWEGVTDDQGQVQFALGIPCQAQVHAGGVRQTCSLSPGLNATVVLWSDDYFIEFFDVATNEPLPDFPIQVSPDSEFGAVYQTMITNQDGEIRFKGIGEGMRLRVTGKDVLGIVADPSSLGLVDLSNWRNPFIAHRGGDQPIRLGVSICGVVLELRDGDTGRALTGPVELVREIEGIVGSAWHDADRISLVSDQGRITLPCALVPKSSESRLRVSVSGFASRVMDSSWGLSAIPGEQMITLVEFAAVERASCSVRVAFSDGAPYLGSLHISEHPMNTWVHKGVGDGSGMHGPFHWDGGDLSVFAFGIKAPDGSSGGPVNPFVGAVGPKRHAIGRIERGSIQNGVGQLILNMVSPYGSIKVTGLPKRSAHLVLLRRDGRIIDRGDSTDSQEDWISFDGLPAGEYLVGPRKWVTNLAAAGAFEKRMHGVITIVEPGEDKELPWVSEWMSEREVSGRVQSYLLDSSRSLALIPVYGPIGSTPISNLIGQDLAKSEGEDIIRLNTDGTYVLPVGEPVPSALRVVGSNRTRTGDTLQVFLPGRNTHLNVRPVNLRWNRPLPEQGAEILVSYDLGCIEYDLPYPQPRQGRTSWFRTWSPSVRGEITLDFVPNCVKAIRFREGGDGAFESIPIQEEIGSAEVAIVNIN